MAENGGDPGGAPVLWMSISQLARARGVTPQSIHERVARLVDSGLLQTRPGRGRERLIDVAQFDRAVGDNRERITVRDEVEAQASPRAPAEGAGLTKARTATAIYQARLLELELAERSGKVVPIDGVQEAATAFGEASVRIFKMPLHRIDGLMAAAARGVSDFRAVLNELIHDQRARFSEALAKLVEHDFAKRGELTEQAEWRRRAEELGSMANGPAPAETAD
jgi:DNA-binding Lrp family transcriptional regulator